LGVDADLTAVDAALRRCFPGFLDEISAVNKKA